MKRDRLALALAFVLTALYAGAMFASLKDPTAQTDWSDRLNPAALHVLGGLVVVGIVLNLARKETPKP